MRNISFALTTNQFRDQTKTVTRRNGWWFLKAGDHLCGVEKSQGLKKGEKIVRLGEIEILSSAPEPLNKLTDDLEYGIQEVIKEGFPDLPPAAFVDFFKTTHGMVSENHLVNRIEFRYCAPLKSEAKLKAINEQRQDMKNRV